MKLAYADCGFTFRKHSSTPFAKRTSSTMQILEEEIYTLRTKMEQSYLEELTLNSEKVIDLSRKLDAKINEYMYFIRRRTTVQ
ncbi:Spo0E family sporulation regulatory protein-aspartic acid phosphatase [Paenibacillus solisilvae]|uniref:Spo0E family sporulation regulatory protein-aspartic acid phosphatase n=1 Tax=Paenibacillus solisilvae TaxID=2486751 RepID=A0ABW0VT38_9BACL